MKKIYLDCSMGAAGDMLMGALYELLSAQEQESFLRKINGIGLQGVSVYREEAVKCGIKGTHIRVLVHGEEEAVHEHSEKSKKQQAQEHSHETGADMHHSHRSLKEIEELVRACRLSKEERTNVLSIYRSIAQAESHVHGTAVEEVHFHEVGMLDALADITGCVLLMEMLDCEEILASFVCTGYGRVSCAHGILPVPAPATAQLLLGIPCYAGEIEGELCTPTGAAILKHYVKRFCQMPVMAVEAVGYGMGRKDFEAANCVRAILGRNEEKQEEVAQLCCNLDDMTPELLAFACERLLEEGALDVYTTSVGMKKGRTGVLLTVLCRLEQRERFAELMFRYTTTLGIREAVCKRHVLERRERVLNTAYGTVRLKQSNGYGVEKEKPEYEDLRRIAKEQDMDMAELVSFMIQNLTK